MRTVTRVAPAAAVAALGLTLAACGSSSSSSSSAIASRSSTSSAAATSSSTPSPSTSSSTSATAGSNSATPDATTLIHEARAAYKTAKSAALQTDTVNDGIRQKTDLTGTLDGSNQDLSVSRGADGSATVRTVDGGYFVKGDKAFWISTTKAPEATALLLAGKWVKAPGSMADSLSGLTIRSFLDESIGPGNITDAELAKATTRTTTFDGKPAYVITDAKTGNTITLDAATKYVLQFDGEQGTSKTKGKVTLTGWNQQPTLTVPPGAISAPSSMGN